MINWIDATPHTHLECAVSAAGGNETTIVISVPIDIGVPALSIPENITLKFLRGGRVIIGDDQRLHIEGPIEAGVQRIFEGSFFVRSKLGTGPTVLLEARGLADQLKNEVPAIVPAQVVVTEVQPRLAYPVVYPQWWGAKGDETHDDSPAFNAATEAAGERGLVMIPAPPARYLLRSTWFIRNKKGLVVTGMGLPSIHFDGSGDIINVTNSEDVLIKHISLQSDGKNRGYGAHIEHSPACVMEHVQVRSVAKDCVRVEDSACFHAQFCRFERPGQGYASLNAGRLSQCSIHTMPFAEPHPPRPPKFGDDYQKELPSTRIDVVDTAGLVAALAEIEPTDIVLANGEYGAGRASHFVNKRGHRLHASSPSRAILKVGIEIGGNQGIGGAVLRGLRFDIEETESGVLVERPNPKYGDKNEYHAVLVWGNTWSGTTRIEDCWFNGHRKLHSAVYAPHCDGLVVRRVKLSSFLRWGVCADSNESSVLQSPIVLEDIDVAHVEARDAGDYNGTGECGISLGNTGRISRARIRHCYWMGLCTLNDCSDSRFEDLDVAGSEKAGVYIEHTTEHCTFERFHVRDCPHGIRSEWANAEHGGEPAGIWNLIQDGTIESSEYGVHFDAGTRNCTIRRVSFRGQANAAIRDHKGVDNLYHNQGNDYSEIGAGAVPVAY